MKDFRKSVKTSNLNLDARECLRRWEEMSEEERMPYRKRSELNIREFFSSSYVSTITLNITLPPPRRCYNFNCVIFGRTDL